MGIGKKIVKDLKIDPTIDNKDMAAYLILANGTVMVGRKHYMDIHICGKIKFKNVLVVLPVPLVQQQIWYHLKYDRKEKQDANPFSEFEPFSNLLGMTGLVESALISLNSEAVYFFPRRHSR